MLPLAPGPLVVVWAAAMSAATELAVVAAALGVCVVGGGGNAACDRGKGDGPLVAHWWRRCRAAGGFVGPGHLLCAAGTTALNAVAVGAVMLLLIVPMLLLLVGGAPAR